MIQCNKINSSKTPGALISGLGAALEDAIEESIRTVVLTGSYKAFCAGATCRRCSSLCDPDDGWRTKV